MKRPLTIGRLSRLTGVNISTIRYYEKIEILPPAERSAGQQRRYDQETVRRLMFVRHGRDLGFSLESVRDLLRLSDQPDCSCDEADAIARRHLEDVRRRLARLTALRSELRAMIGGCRGDKIRSCRVIEVLGDHDQCLADRHV